MTTHVDFAVHASCWSSFNTRLSNTCPNDNIGCQYHNTCSWSNVPLLVHMSTRWDPHYPFLLFHISCQGGFFIILYSCCFTCRVLRSSCPQFLLWLVHVLCLHDRKLILVLVELIDVTNFKLFILFIFLFSCLVLIQCTILFINRIKVPTSTPIPPM
jgi:hypothetical protein